MHQTNACYVARSSEHSILSMPVIIFEEGPLTTYLREEFREEVGIIKINF